MRGTRKFAIDSHVYETRFFKEYRILHEWRSTSNKGYTKNEGNGKVHIKYVYL